MTKTLVVVLSGLFALTLNPAAEASSDEQRSTFEAANTHYVAGDYEMALKLYVRLADDQGLRNPVLYLNLGNAHFRTDALGAAVHSYRRALLLEPQDGRLRSSLAQNLEVTRARLSRRYLAGSENRQFIFEDASGMLHTITHIVGEGLLITLFLVFWAMFCVILMLRRLRPSTGSLSVSAITVGVASLLCGLMLWGQVVTGESMPLGVIVQSDVLLHEAPHVEASGHALPEGMEVRVLEDGEAWVHVALANGRQGFVPTTTLWAL